MVTINDLAKYTKISKSTISRYLNGQSVSKEKQKIIADAIKKLNYRPNRIAKSLKTNVTNTIALVLPSVTTYFFSVFVETIAKKLFEGNFNTVLYVTNGNINIEKKLLKEVAGNMVDAVISATGSKSLEKTYQSLKKTIITIDRKISDSFPLITSNNKESTYLLTKEICSKGCKNILFVRPSDRSIEPANFREEGYKKYLDEIGYEKNVISIEEFEKVFVQRKYIDKYDAVMFWNDQSAFELGSLIFSNNKNNKKIMLSGYDDSIFAKHMNPGLTTVHQPINEISEKAYEVLKKMLDKKDVDKLYLIKNEIIVRDSTKKEG